MNKVHPSTNTLRSTAPGTPQRLIAAAVFALVLSACGPSQEIESLKKQVVEMEGHKKKADELKLELDAVTKERNSLKVQLDELSNTPSKLLSNVAVAVGESRTEEATKALGVIQAKYPYTPEAKKAQDLVDSLMTKLAKQREEANRIEALGFKAIPTSSAFDAGGVKVKVGTANFTKQYISDRYGNSYHYSDADRDHKYLVFGLSATAAKGVNDPDLPGFAVYWADGKQLHQISKFALDFVRWEDYGSYLGNYNDSGNDFAKSATVAFTMGAQGSDTELAKRPLYVIATAAGCKQRRHERFRRPPVFYSGICPDLGKTLHLDGFTNGSYKLKVVRRID